MGLIPSRLVVRDLGVLFEPELEVEVGRPDGGLVRRVLRREHLLEDPGLVELHVGAPELVLVLVSEGGVGVLGEQGRDLRVPQLRVVSQQEAEVAVRDETFEPAVKLGEERDNLVFIEVQNHRLRDLSEVLEVEAPPAGAVQVGETGRERELAHALARLHGEFVAEDLLEVDEVGELPEARGGVVGPQVHQSLTVHGAAQPLRHLEISPALSSFGAQSGGGGVFGGGPEADRVGLITAPLRDHGERLGEQAHARVTRALDIFEVRVHDGAAVRLAVHGVPELLARGGADALDAVVPDFDAGEVGQAFGAVGEAPELPRLVEHRRVLGIGAPFSRVGPDGEPVLRDGIVVVNLLDFDLLLGHLDVVFVEAIAVDPPNPE
mmetsp:Transcript_11722/g.27499  ORF Transcript_11722/g.27499 Transcript_11722/m.27499 type:complete len:378 (-) Transcript_11722:210-1343(-)|eukprot:CAMPEP_0172586550 /NCGR_PEP_ID=MMETSP1068-20121228/5914_1 /TAXON_ID=35684 /ORGANISM="Pseudopedinella elastica, Strain CCMP716" /LENGTH=377 /DNA_ID=CAMNT_0013381401 /DNA_START=212 /DNA_END=1345 /DNA_ORIENTATION=+